VVTLTVDVIKVYDEKGHTFLKRKHLEHLGVKPGDEILVIPAPGKRLILAPLKDKREILDELLPKIGVKIDEEKLLSETTTLHFQI